MIAMNIFTPPWTFNCLASLENAVTKMPTPEMSHFLIVHTPSPREESTKRRLVKGSKTR